MVFKEKGWIKAYCIILFLLLASCNNVHAKNDVDQSSKYPNDKKIKEVDDLPTSSYTSKSLHLLRVRGEIIFTLCLGIVLLVSIKYVNMFVNLYSSLYGSVQNSNPSNFILIFWCYFMSLLAFVFCIILSEKRDREIER